MVRCLSRRATKSVRAVLSAAELEGDLLVLRFAPRGGHAREIEDRVPLSAQGDMGTIHAVGRVLRLLRAARVRAPGDPYRLVRERDFALDLARRCLGAAVQLRLARRLTRVLTIWTESGVQQIRGLLDCIETADGLSVLRRDGRGTLHISRRDLIRYETTTEEDFIVSAIES
jgi:hypothetical protein